MKKLIIILIQILTFASPYAQSPQKMSYQAVIRDQNNSLIKNGTIGMQVSILQGSATGNIVFSEIYNPNPVTNDNGLVTVEIGSGIATTGSFEDVDWGNGTFFLKTETDPSGGTNYTITGVSQLLSVPYALFSGKTAQTYSAGTGISITDGTISNTAPNASHTGDATGSGQLTVVKIQGRPVYNKQPGHDEVLQWDGSQWAPATLPATTPGWSLTGNSGIDPSVNFIGTKDSRPLIFKVNNILAGEISPSNNSTYFGRGVGSSSASGDLYNTAFGSLALYKNVSGKNNVAIGFEALSNNTYGQGNVAVGNYALYSQDYTNNNIAFDSWNTAIGYKTLYNNNPTSIETGYKNSAFGYHALYSNTRGFQNVALGSEALYANTSGDRNTAIGHAALNNLTIGDNNTAVGFNAGPPNDADVDNSIAIGYNAVVTGDDMVRLGNEDIKALICKGPWVNGVGLTATAVWVNEAGEIGHYANSARYMENINDMAPVDWLYDLRPATFIFKGDKNQITQYGLVAEEVEQVKPELVISDRDGRPETVSYSSLVPAMLKALQDQQKMIEEQQRTIEDLQAMVNQLMSGQIHK